MPTMYKNIDTDSSTSMFEMYTSSDRFIRPEMADVPVQQAAGSTLPLVISRKKGGADDSEDDNYNPFEHRKVEHPTS